MTKLIHRKMKEEEQVEGGGEEEASRREDKKISAGGALGGDRRRRRRRSDCAKKGMSRLRASILCSKVKTGGPECAKRGPEGLSMYLI